MSELIKRLVSTYKAADEQIKQCERYTLASPSAAVNQMRYAGSHLVKFFKGGMEDAKDDIKRENIEKAINHCRRATFDALETLIFSQLEFISDFQDLCRSKRDVETIYPDYVSDFTELAALQERLQAFRMVQSLSEDDKEELVDIAGQVSRLKRKVLRLKIGVEKQESVEVADEIILAVQQFLLSFTATVLGTVLGVAGVMFAVWDVLPNIWWARMGGVVILLAAFAFSCKKFYGWSANKLLTEKQRRQLSDRLNIRWS